MHRPGNYQHYAHHDGNVEKEKAPPHIENVEGTERPVDNEEHEEESRREQDIPQLGRELSEYWRQSVHAVTKL